MRLPQTRRNLSAINPSGLGVSGMAAGCMAAGCLATSGIATECGVATECGKPWVAQPHAKPSVDPTTLGVV